MPVTRAGFKLASSLHFDSNRAQGVLFSSSDGAFLATARVRARGTVLIGAGGLYSVISYAVAATRKKATGCVTAACCHGWLQLGGRNEIESLNETAERQRIQFDPP